MVKEECFMSVTVGLMALLVMTFLNEASLLTPETEKIGKLNFTHLSISDIDS